MNMLFKIVSEVSDDINSKITEETDLITDMGYDSLKFVELLAKIEDAYQIEFDIDDIEIDKLRSMQMLKELIEKKVGEKNYE